MSLRSSSAVTSAAVLLFAGCGGDAREGDQAFGLDSTEACLKKSEFNVQRARPGELAYMSFDEDTSGAIMVNTLNAPDPDVSEAPKVQGVTLFFQTTAEAAQRRLGKGKKPKERDGMLFGGQTRKRNVVVVWALANQSLRETIDSCLR